jgi:hypothetical protein
LLLEVQGDNIRLHSAEYAKGIYQSVGLPSELYSGIDDLDLLAECLAYELDSREKTKSLEFVKKKIKRRSIDKLLSSSDDLVSDLSILDELAEPLKESLIELCEGFLKKGDGTHYIKQEDLDEGDTKTNLFYRIKGSKVEFGTCKYLHWVDDATFKYKDGENICSMFYGFNATIIKKTSLFKKKNKYIFNFRLLGSTPSYSYSSIIRKSTKSVDELISVVKQETEADKWQYESGLFLQYLTQIIRFPEFIIKANQAKRKRISSNLKSAISGISGKDEAELRLVGEENA